MTLFTKQLLEIDGNDIAWHMCVSTASQPAMNVFVRSPVLSCSVRADRKHESSNADTKLTMLLISIMYKKRIRYDAELR